jgi:hypothetical protein
MARKIHFKGTTRAGRELVIWWDRSQGSDNPGDNQFWATLDSEPVTLLGFQDKGDTIVVNTEDHGTFSAVKEGAQDADQSQALRSYLNRRPLTGRWNVEVEGSQLRDQQWRFIVAVGNGHALQRIEVRLPEPVATQWRQHARVGETLDDVVRAHLETQLRSRKWEQIEAMGDHPTTIIVGRLLRS